MVTITGNGVTYDENTDLDKVRSDRALRNANEWIAKWADLGATATYDPATGYYKITDAQGQKYRTNSPTAVHADIRHAFGLAPTTSNPWYEGADGPGGTPGPLTATPEYPQGGPTPGGFTPNQPNLPPNLDRWLNMIQNVQNAGQNATGGMFTPSINVPGQGGGGGGSQLGPPQGVPLNPIAKENPMVFAPYGQGASRFSDTLTFGGLPRSTGPWGEMGGYYGGNPYTQMPEGYNPPNPNNYGNNPGSISPGGNIATNPIPSTNLPANPWSPAKPIEFPTPQAVSPNIPEGMSQAEYDALLTLGRVNVLGGTGP